MGDFNPGWKEESIEKIKKYTEEIAEEKLKLWESYADAAPGVLSEKDREEYRELCLLSAMFVARKEAIRRWRVEIAIGEYSEDINRGVGLAEALFVKLIKHRDLALGLAVMGTEYWRRMFRLFLVIVFGPEGISSELEKDEEHFAFPSVYFKEVKDKERLLLGMLHWFVSYIICKPEYLNEEGMTKFVPDHGRCQISYRDIMRILEEEASDEVKKYVVSLRKKIKNSKVINGFCIGVRELPDSPGLAYYILESAMMGYTMEEAIRWGASIRHNTMRALGINSDTLDDPTTVLLAGIKDEDQLAAMAREIARGADVEWDVEEFGEWEYNREDPEYYVWGKEEKGECVLDRAIAGVNQPNSPSGSR